MAAVARWCSSTSELAASLQKFFVSYPLLLALASSSTTPFQKLFYCLMKRGKFCWHWQLRKILHFFLLLLLLCLAKSGYFCKTKDPRSKMIDRKKRNILTYNGNQKLEDTRIIYHASVVCAGQARTPAQTFMYCKVASSNTSHLGANTVFFRLLMKGIFDLYVL